MSSFSFPSNYGQVQQCLFIPGTNCFHRYVLLVATASTCIASLHTNLTARYRKAAGVPFPNPYASHTEAAASIDKFRFNCAQKAHANFTENHASFVFVLLIAGLGYPLWSAILGVSWCIARVLYALGYTRKENAENGKGRHWGSWWALPHLLLMGTAVLSSWRLSY
jgi:glutathione S-transferase